MLIKLVQLYEKPKRNQTNTQLASTNSLLRSIIKTCSRQSPTKNHELKTDVEQHEIELWRHKKCMNWPSLKSIFSKVRRQINFKMFNARRRTRYHTNSLNEVYVPCINGNCRFVPKKTPKIQYSRAKFSKCNLTWQYHFCLEPSSNQNLTAANSRTIAQQRSNQNFFPFVTLLTHCDLIALAACMMYLEKGL